MDYIFDSLRAWAQIDLDAIRKNHTKVKSLLPEGVKVAAVIKADAYGHGAGRIARLLEHDTDYFAVAMTDEVRPRKEERPDPKEELRASFRAARSVIDELERVEEQREYEAEGDQDEATE
jgi:hypothetical protein